MHKKITQDIIKQFEFLKLYTDCIEKSIKKVLEERILVEKNLNLSEKIGISLAKEGKIKCFEKFITDKTAQILQSEFIKRSLKITYDLNPKIKGKELIILINDFNDIISDKNKKLATQKYKSDTLFIIVIGFFVYTIYFLNIYSLIEGSFMSVKYNTIIPIMPVILYLFCWGLKKINIEINFYKSFIKVLNRTPIHFEEEKKRTPPN